MDIHSRHDLDQHHALRGKLKNPHGGDIENVFAFFQGLFPAHGDFTDPLHEFVGPRSGDDQSAVDHVHATVRHPAAHEDDGVGGGAEVGKTARSDIV